SPRGRIFRGAVRTMMQTTVTMKWAVAGVALIAAAASLVGTVRAQDPAATKERMIALGKQHKTAADLYAALRKQAGGGRRLSYTNLPDWTGVYTRARGGITYDPDQKPGAPPTAKLTPEFQARLAKRIEEANRGIEWDPISTCAPPGH